MPCRHHLAGNGLREEEQGTEVNVHYGVPFLEGEVDGIVALDDAGIVDKDIDASERGFRFGDDVGDMIGRAKIGADDMGHTAERSDF